ncbi:MAG: ABC transporter C-terminal domain-containing protein, partial [Thermoanaerobaculia bacterium]
PPPPPPPRPDRAAERRRQKELARVEALESEIAGLELEISSFEESFADPSIARDGNRIRTLRSKIESRKNRLSEKMSDWEELLRKLGKEEPAVR